MIDRQQEFQFAGLGFLQQVLGEVQFVFLNQRFPNLLPKCLEERVGHSAADDERIDFIQQVGDDWNLVANLGATQNRNKRLLGMVQCFAEVFKLLLHEQP